MENHLATQTDQNSFTHSPNEKLVPLNTQSLTQNKTKQVKWNLKKIKFSSHYFGVVIKMEYL